MKDTYQPPWDHNLLKNSKLEIQIPNRHWKKNNKKDINYAEKQTQLQGDWKTKMWNKLNYKLNFNHHTDAFLQTKTLTYSKSLRGHEFSYFESIITNLKYVSWMIIV
jgi:hypothetical protein